jgi:hypothetical protein
VIQARFKAAGPGADAGGPFAGGREPSGRVEPVAPEQTGRMLSVREAAKLLVRFEGMG